MTRIRLKRKQTLKGRIQNSLTMSSFLSILISMVAILTVLGIIIIPIGNFFTDSVNNSIYEKFVSGREFSEEMNSKHLEMGSLKDLSFQELVELDLGNNSDQSIFNAINKSENIDNFGTEFKAEIAVLHNQETEIIIEKCDEKTKTNLLISTIRTIEEIDNFMTVGEAFGINWVSVELVIGEETMFVVPSVQTTTSDTTTGKFDDISSRISLVDINSKQVGFLKTTLNGDLIYFAVVPIIIMAVAIALITLFIVKILILPISRKIVRPITGLVSQMEKIASTDMLEVKDMKLEQKNPPNEILQLINHSNAITSKLQNSYAMLENHKEELEAQNEELDIQNVDLIESQELLKTAQTRLVQSEKMASIGQITAAIAHEINTPLGAISSNNQLLDMMLMKLEMAISSGDEDKMKKVLGNIKKSNQISIDGVQRVNEIIKNLRNFSRIDQAEFQNADVNEGIRNVLVLTSNLWKNKLSIEEHYGALPDINCFPSLLNQVFMNVIVNAIHATEKNGKIIIHTDFDDTHVYVRVSDDGSGINSGLLETIFESGFTTKDRDKGTGLGLSISKDIILKHNGTIVATNNPDKGATFTISLPIVQVCDKDSGGLVSK